MSYGCISFINSTHLWHLYPLGRRHLFTMFTFSQQTHHLFSHSVAHQLCFLYLETFWALCLLMMLAFIWSLVARHNSLANCSRLHSYTNPRLWFPSNHLGTSGNGLIAMIYTQKLFSLFHSFHMITFERLLDGGWFCLSCGWWLLLQSGDI